MAIVNNLYPPILPDTYPSFLRNGSCIIYFAISAYNSYEEIKSVQISLINQKTNISAFDTELYPTGIKCTTLNRNQDISNEDYNYYIQIPASDLKEKIFGLNQFYKIQLRFSSVAPPDGEIGMAWLNDNINNFSQWSKTALIKGISQPKIQLNGFDISAENEQELILSNVLRDITGKLLFYEEPQENEYLKSYNIKFYQTGNSEDVLFDSGEIYTNPYNPNEINYTLTYDLVDGFYYTMVLTYTTNNLYTSSLSYNFIAISSQGVDVLEANITATPDNENGRIKINILSNNDKNFIGSFTIRRASSKNNFHIWEDIKTVIYLEGNVLNYTWYDNTVESGTWYKYCAQKRTANGSRGPIIQINNPVMCELDDMFLTRGDAQLKIQFNPTIGDFKYNVTESQQVTIGSKYPYIRRNGNNYFRTFSIGGLISSFVDTTNWYDIHYYEDELHEHSEFRNNKDEIKNFTSKEDIYKDSLNLYQDYNDKNNINNYNDFIYERLFREKVYDFLYKNNVKLFRSTTEGNILIKLMNISFQPMDTLGRRLYSFTATAVEVDEVSIKNYDKYGINIIGDYIKTISLETEVFGTLQGTFSLNDGNILNKINTKYAKQAVKGYINEIKYLKQLKIQIESQPYVIIEENNQLIKANNNTTITKSNSTIGYIVIINGIETIISPTMERYSISPNQQNSSIKVLYNGFFELKESNTQITDLQFKDPTQASIIYTAQMETKEDTSRLINRYTYYYKPGQLFGVFNPNQLLVKKIFNKYFLDYKRYYQRLVGVESIKMESSPGAVVYVKDQRDESNYNRHILENGFLQLKDDDVNIKEFYFCGIHLIESKNPNAMTEIDGITSENFDYSEANTPYEKLSDITDPENGHVYLLSALGFSYESEDSINPYLADATTEEDNIYKVIQGTIQQDPNNDWVVNDIPNSENLYKLVIENIKDDAFRFVYYYGSWYLLSEGKEKSDNLLKGDIRQVRDNEFIKSSEIPIETQDTVGDNIHIINQKSYIIQNLIDNGVYTIDGEDYIYYHKQWYPFTKNNDVLCPVEGIVDYFCEIVRGDYNNGV